MLADEILAASGSSPDRFYQGAFSALGEAIRQAKRFDLAPGVIVTAETVKASSVKAQLRALPLCRFPFGLIWMEWPGSDPAYASFREHTASELAPMPQRVGVLLQADESRQAGVMTFAWLHRHAGLNACPLGCAFDWREDKRGCGYRTFRIPRIWKDGQRTATTDRRNISRHAAIQRQHRSRSS